MRAGSRRMWLVDNTDCLRIEFSGLCILLGKGGISPLTWFNKNKETLRISSPPTADEKEVATHWSASCWIFTSATDKHECIDLFHRKWKELQPLLTVGRHMSSQGAAAWNRQAVYWSGRPESRPLSTETEVEFLTWFFRCCDESLKLIWNPSNVGAHVEPQRERKEICLTGGRIWEVRWGRQWQSVRGEGP